MSLTVLKSFSLDFAKAPPLEYVFAKQGDQNSRILEITPLNNGAAYTIPEGTTARFGAKKPDGTQILDDATIDNGKIYVTLSGQALAVSGIAVAEVALYGSSDELLSSQHFFIKVESFAIDPDAAESSDEYKSFETALLELEDAIQATENIFKPSFSINDKTPYLFRKSGGGDVDIGNQKSFVSLVGCTVVWNQLIEGDSAYIELKSNHKYIVKSTSDTWSVVSGTGLSLTLKKAYDITLMLGSAVANYIYSLEQAAAGTGIQYFKNLFPKCENAEYNAGSLISVKTSASITTGLNQWDEDWEIGAIDNGNNVTYNQSIRGKNYMPCIPNTVYHIHIGSGAYVVIWWYGATYNYLSNSTVNNTTFTAPANAHYFRISMSAAYGTVYNNDICINIHGERDGEYEAYYKHEYALDSTRELHGVMMLDANNNLYYDGDTYSPSGAGANNYGIIDLGTLTWSGSNGSFSTSLSLMKKINSVNAVRIVCPKYIQAASTVSQSIRTNGMYIAVNDSSYSDAATFKTALSGIYLVYPLETPTAEAASAYTNPQTVNGDGTEQFVDSRTIPVPVGQDTYYRNNLRKRLLETPDSPRADGDYILQRRNGKNEYAPLPDPPSTNGTYKFTATVSGGTVTYSWVSST